MNITTGIFGFFLLCCGYAAQYWAYRCFQELKRMNDRAEGAPRA
ncbi:MAG TPA: hypothetical protein VHD62_14545 [Opitutaceae bacterium]|nr:hypothetical protein [Opitutaceae bacterium]